MTFLRCLRRYLFRVLFFPRILFFSFSASKYSNIGLKSHNSNFVILIPFFYSET